MDNKTQSSKVEQLASKCTFDFGHTDNTMITLNNIIGKHPV